MNEVVKVKVEEAKPKTRKFRDGSGTPLIHTAEINPFFEGVYRRYHTHQNPLIFIDPDGQMVFKVLDAYVYVGKNGINFTTGGALEQKYSQLSGLSTEMKVNTNKLLFQMENEYKSDMRIVWGLRTQNEQNQMVQNGVSQTRNSMHLNQDEQGAAAIDVIDRRYGYEGADAEQFFENYGREGQNIGLEWGGAWDTFYDPSHMQLPETQELNAQNFCTDCNIH